MKSPMKSVSLPAFVLTLATFIGLNVATHLRTVYAPAVDGFHAIGMPFVFHRCGGDCHPQVCDAFPFHPGAFAADAVIAIGAALAMGWFVARLRHPRRTR